MSLSSYRLDAQIAVTDMARAEEFYANAREPPIIAGLLELGGGR